MTAEMKKKPPEYRITLLCRKDGSRITTAEHVKTRSFPCPCCKQTLIYLHDQNRLSAHGEQKPGADKEAPPPLHELRKVEELTRPAPGANKV
jgi:hypothetical protein